MRYRYQIIAKNGYEQRVIYDSFMPVKEVSLIDPVLHMEADNAGSFECKVPPDNICYRPQKDGTTPMIQEMKTKIIVKRLDKNRIIWTGRVLSFEKDFYNTPTIYTEGALSYLNDTIQVQYQFPENWRPIDVLRSILAIHNNRVTGIDVPNGAIYIIGTTVTPLYDGATTSPIVMEDGTEHTPSASEVVHYKKDLYYYTGSKWKYFDSERYIQVGVVTLDLNVFANNPFSTTYETTFSTIDRLRSTYGGHIRIRYSEHGIALLDWFKDYNADTVSRHTISFGVNLLDLTRKTDGSALANAILPLGKTINSSESMVIGEKIPIVNLAGDWGGPYKPDNYLAFGNGYRIVKSGDTYIYELEDSNCCTGYWDSAEGTDKSLRVYPGETYYLCSAATASTTLYIITSGKMGRSGSYAIATKNAGSSWNEMTNMAYQKITIPEDASNPNASLYLNLSAIKKTGAYPPITEDDIRMKIYRGRTITSGTNEKISLKGLDNGVFQNGDQKYYLLSDSGDTTLITPTQYPNGWYVFPKSVGSSIPIPTIDSSTNTYTVYPDTPNIPSNHIMPFSDFPDDAEVNTWWVDSNTGRVYQRIDIHEEGHYSLSDDYKAWYVDGLYLLDMESISKYGRIEKTIEYSDCTNAYMLFYLAVMEQYISALEQSSIDVSGLDMSLLDNSLYPVDVLDGITIISGPHNVVMTMPIQEFEIAFNDPASQTFSVGFENNNLRISDGIYASGLRK